MYKLVLIAGARPNFMKIAPLIRAIQERSDAISYELVHTGQHYDQGMSDIFFEELGIPHPNYHLNVGSGTHAEQTAKIMTAFEPICVSSSPDCVLVVGDVNSTLACAIVAKKLNVKLAHVEAGLRSGDLSMPEEINRMVTDSITDYFFVTEPSGVTNLLKEGKTQDSIHHVGHVMIDNLFHEVGKLDSSPPSSFDFDVPSKYGIITLHRPANVDDGSKLAAILSALGRIAQKIPLIFAVHPRTRAAIAQLGMDVPGNIIFCDPLGYRAFLRLWSKAEIVLTDSGGLQEETTALGVPCLTLRENTERPITIESGSNKLVGTDSTKIYAAAMDILGSENPNYPKPDLWDGNAANRILNVLVRPD